MSSCYTCSYCSKSYTIKYYFERHTLVCEFFHKPKKEKNRIMESDFPVLNETQLRRVIESLLYKQEILESRIEKLEKENKRKRKINIEQSLNSEYGPVPVQTLREWTKTIPLTTIHLEIILKTDLLTGMITCIKEALESMDVNGIPCCAFNQKQNVLYFYDVREKTGPKWTILSNGDLISILSILSDRILQLFLSYSDNPSPIYAKVWDENQTIYLGKVRGESCKTALANSIKEYLYSTLKRNFVEFEIV